MKCKSVTVIGKALCISQLNCGAISGELRIRFVCAVAQSSGHWDLAQRSTQTSHSLLKASGQEGKVALCSKMPKLEKKVGDFQLMQTKTQTHSYLPQGESFQFKYCASFYLNTDLLMFK